MTILERICRRHHKKKPVPPVPTPVPAPGPPVPVPVPTKATLIQIVNRCTVLTDAVIAKAVPDFQAQVAEDFLHPSTGWTGGPYRLEFVGTGAKTNPAAWQIVVLNDSDQAGALGYHDVTPQGLPLGKVFAKTDMQYGESWSVTLSHELLEMLGDPNINDGVTDPKTGWVYIYEDCDAVEGDSYVKGSTRVSNFVTTAWFGGGKHVKVSESGRFDWLGKLTAPFTLSAGGYISVDKHDGAGWTQIYGERGPQQGYRVRPKVGSRRERRTVPRGDWIRSAA